MSKQIKLTPSTWEASGKKDPTQLTVKTPVQPSAWNALSGVQEPNMIRQFDGVNYLNSFAIKDSHATRNQNVTTSKYPALAVRDGGTKQGNTLNTNSPVNGMAVYKNGELHAISGGIWYVFRNNAWVTLKTGLNTNAKWSFINFQGNYSTMHLLATNGVDVPYKYDGTNVIALPNAPAAGNFVTTHDNRVYLAAKSTVHFSALRKAEDWTTVNDSGQIVVETSDGLDITGLVAGSSRLTVFKKNSIHELFGSSPSNYQMKIVTDHLGCPAGNTAQVIGGIIYFLGNDNVYRYSGGSLPTDDFALQIKDVIKNINQTAVGRSVSWTDGKRYYLAIPTGTHTEPDTILEFDMDTNTWNIWTFTTPVTSAILNDNVYLGNQLGEVWKLDGSGTDNGTPIGWEWVSKPFTFSSLSAKTRWYRMWVTADIPAGANLTIYVSNEEKGENWMSVQAITANSTIQSKEILIPTNLINQSNWVRIRLQGTGRVVVYEVSRQERVFPFGQG